jgi:protease-4
MTTEKLVAGVLVAACLVAAAGSWFTGGAHAGDDRGGKSLFAGKGDIARLMVTGAIVDQGGQGLGGGGTTSAQNLLKQIARIRADGCKVILLQLNSPGGTASGSQEVYEELELLKKEKGVKVIAAMGDLAASGAYYIAAAADEIVANPATLTGSIGVIMHTTNWQGLMGKIGVTNGAIKSAPMKDIGSPDRPMTTEEHQLLQALIDDTYQQFLEAVSHGRKIPMDKLRPLADGRIFTGRQALANHLVDKLGNMHVAESEARRLGGLSADAKIKDYSQDDWAEILGGLFSRSSVHPLAELIGTKQALLQSGALDKIPLMMYE